jgi:hypothetical protein
VALTLQSSLTTDRFHGRVIGRLVVGQQIDVRFPYSVIGAAFLKPPAMLDVDDARIYSNTRHRSATQMMLLTPSLCTRAMHSTRMPFRQAGV